MSDSKARGFLEFIVAHPDDDSARLIFADWLEEQGDAARAEFIRVQIERASLPEWDARQVQLRLCEDDLIKLHGRKWMAELPNIEGIIWKTFRRGFVATATITSFAILKKNLSDCWAAAPIEAVTIRWPRKRESVEDIAPIAGLRELIFNARVVDQSEVTRLAHAPLLSTLRVLNIPNVSLGVGGFRRLMASPHLANLTALRAPHNSIGNSGISALFDAPSLNALAELDLSETGNYGRYGEDPIIEPPGVVALATWRGMARLRSLNLSGNDVGREGLLALLRSPHATGLKELALRRNGLDGQAMQEFEAARPELQLDVLNLGENLLRDLGVAYLAGAACLNKLKALELDQCEILRSAANRLTKATFLDTLGKLNVNYNGFGPEGMRALLDAKPQALHTLLMVNNDLGDEGARQLADSPASDTLLEVHLDQNELKDDAAQALAQTKHLQNLSILRLNHNRMSKPAAAALADSPLGKRLAILEVTPWPDDVNIPF